MKRLAGLICFCMLAILALTPGAEAAATFSDTNSHWAQEYIDIMAKAGYISGYSDGTFKPDKVVTRAEFTSVLMRCQEMQPNTAASSSFSDVKTHWAKGYINTAVANNIIVPGDYGSTFGPNTGIKRSEICAMLARTLGKQPDNGTTNFKDNANVNKSQYRGYIKVASDLGLLSGYPNGNFEPFQEVTRAQMCKVISNLFTIQGKTFTVANDNTTDTPGTNTTTTSSGIVGDFSSLAIGDQTYDLLTTPIAFKSGFTNINVTSLTIQQGFLFINGEYRFKVESSLSDLDIIVNNTRYTINEISSSGSRLIIFPGKRKIAYVTVSGHKYDTDYVNLYINGAKSNYYLSDLSVVDANTVSIGGKDYTLSSADITIELGSSFYNITGIKLSTTDTLPTLDETDSVLVSGYTIADVSAIFVGTSTLKLSTIGELRFLVNGTMYDLSKIDIDGAGNFIANDASYPCSDVIMAADSDLYNIDHVSILKNKLIFYCTLAKDQSLVLVNDKYMDISDVTILKGGVAYDLEDVIVVRTNVVRVGGKQYTLDSDFQVSYGGKIYYIDKITWDSGLSVTEITTSEKTAAYSKPVKYKFYVDNKLYQDGVTDDTNIYTSNKWVKFSAILVPDPAHFTVNGSSYELIGSLVLIDKIEYKVTDTAWHGATLVLDLYLEEV